MLYKNATVCDGDFRLIKADIKTQGEYIEDIGIFDGDGIDCTGKVILPGFVDIHIHGCCGADCTDGNSDSVLKMSEYAAKCGITSFCPTTMTVPVDEIKNSFQYIRNACGKEKGAYIQGINMEGPFISPAKKGAQDEKNILLPDIELLEELNEISAVKLVDIAPEMNGASEFIGEVKRKYKNMTVSAAHTQATYEQAMTAFGLGVTHCTHLFNAMTQFLSRAPGLVGAAFDSDSVTAELICDGIHIAPAALRTAFKMLGKDRSIVISDSTMASGLPDGDYTLGGQKVIKKDAVRLPDGTLAGSATNLFEEFKNILSFGIPLEQAIRSLTVNPARVIGADSSTGSIEVGKSADFVILNESFSDIFATVVKGKRVI